MFANVAQMRHQSVLKPGENAWRTAQADRGEFLVDGAQYYRDLHRHLVKAEFRVFITGWDLCSDLELCPAASAGGNPNQLAPLLQHLVQTRPELQIYILVWDSAPFFTKFREPKQMARERLAHPRIHLVFNRALPTFASYHHKFVIIDEKVAYCGGIDLTANRRDTPQHHPMDACHETHGKFLPIHDLQVRLEGDVASDMADLGRIHWARATGEYLPALIGPEPEHKEGIHGGFGAVPVAISRTSHAFRAWSNCHEIEELVIDLISSAEHTIYIENQYLSAASITKALCEVLRKPGGPEVVIVTSKVHHGWWEKRSLGTLRNRQLDALEEADHEDRFGIFYPSLPNFEDGVSVHSKLLIVDDMYLSMGSANFTNRSMGLDTEVMLTLDATSDPGIRTHIRNLRYQLLGEHLSVGPDQVANRIQRSGSMLAVIREFEKEGRCLKALPREEEDWASWWMQGRKWADPSEGLRGETEYYRLFYPVQPTLEAQTGWSWHA